MKAKGLGWLAGPIAWLAAAPALAAPCATREVASFPVTMHGLQPVITAKIDGTDIDMLADSGAFYTAITTSTAGRLGLKYVTANAGYQMRGLGGGAATGVTTAHQFVLGTMDLGHFDLLVGGSDVGLGGMIGQNILGRHDADYDLTGGRIRLVDPQGCTGPPQGWGGRFVWSMPIENTGRRNQHIYGSVTVNGVQLRAAFDTGAMLTVLTMAAAAKVGVTPQTPGVVETAAGRGVGGSPVRSWLGRFDTVKIGQEQGRDIPLRFVEASGGEFDMLIGADFFLTHRVYVSNARHLLYISPNQRIVITAPPLPAEMH